MPVFWLALFFAMTFALVTGAVLGVALTLQPTGTSLLKEEQLSSISAWDSLLTRFDFVDIMRCQLQQAGLAWSVGRLTLSMLLCASITAVVAREAIALPLWAVIAAAWIAGLTPYWFVLCRRSRRLQTFASQFPDALESLGRAMRAGYPLITALEAVATESLPPLGPEIRKVCAETKLGLPLARALDNLRGRISLPEVDLFAAAVQLHSRTGGRLTDAIANLSESLREQEALRGEVRALAAHGRATGMILTVLPVVIALVMGMVSPTYIGVLIAHPYGKHMLVAAILSLIAAQFIIRRIVDIRI